MTRLPVNGVELSVLDEGSGPPVLLLHGFPDSHAMWAHQVEALVAGGYRAIVPDLRGFGESSRPVDVEAYAMGTLVSDVRALLDALDLERVAVVGHDWGAALAWQVTQHLPERVAGLTVLSVGHAKASVAAGLKQTAMAWYMLWFLFPGVAEKVMPRDDWRFYREWAWGGQTSPDCERQIAGLSRPGALAAALNWYRANIRPERAALTDPDLVRQPPVLCPVLGIWGSGDPFLCEEQMEWSGRYVDGPWTYERIDGAGHWLTAQAPDRVSELLLGWLPGVTSSS